MTSAPTTRLTGVYHADGSILGELRYLVGRRLGTAHCALCDITHGRVREREAWRRQRAALPLPFAAVHLDERTGAERAASEGRTPCVLAHSDDGISVLLGPEELETCGGDPAGLAAAIRAALGDEG